MHRAFDHTMSNNCIAVIVVVPTLDNPHTNMTNLIVRHALAHHKKGPSSRSKTPCAGFAFHRWRHRSAVSPAPAGCQCTDPFCHIDIVGHMRPGPQTKGFQRRCTRPPTRQVENCAGMFSSILRHTRNSSTVLRPSKSPSLCKIQHWPTACSNLVEGKEFPQY